MLSAAFVAVLPAISSASALSTGDLNSRAVVPHDSISPWPEIVPGEALGNAIKRFEPYLHIAHGCQPYSAVDGKGNTSGGLKDTGNVDAGCRDQSKGQTYVRGQWHNGRYALMYSWYFPKDQPAAGDIAGGHRHDWENIVVWLDNPSNANPRLLGAAASGHGGYKKTKTPQTQGSRVKVEYFTQFPTNHELQFTNTLGRDLPMMWYDFFPQASKTALENTDFGSANVPFKNANFAGNLDKAWIN